jgi:hypothetical protein
MCKYINTVSDMGLVLPHAVSRKAICPGIELKKREENCPVKGGKCETEADTNRSWPTTGTVPVNRCQIQDLSCHTAAGMPFVLLFSFRRRTILLFCCRKAIRTPMPLAERIFVLPFSCRKDTFTTY